MASTDPTSVAAMAPETVPEPAAANPVSTTTTTTSPAPAATETSPPKDDDSKDEKTKDQTPSTETPQAPEPVPGPVRAPTAPLLSGSTQPATGSATKKSAKEVNRPQSIDIDRTKPEDFEGSVATDNTLPSLETLRKLDNYVILDRDGKSHTFKSLYSGRNVARRMLVIFVRHFFCGMCQEYIRALCESIKTDALLGLPVSTFITIIGCGDPGLIQMYADATNCPYPIYTDPNRKIYKNLGMIQTKTLGTKPAYVKHSFIGLTLQGIKKGLPFLSSGLAFKYGNVMQVGGEFLFEPADVATPISSPRRESVSQTPLSEGAPTQHAQGSQRTSASHHEDEDYDPYGTEEKRITWCNRMKTQRDHVEIPELMEILGLDGDGQPIKDEKRWAKALKLRKGTGLSLASKMSRTSTQQDRVAA